MLKGLFSLAIGIASIGKSLNKADDNEFCSYNVLTFHKQQLKLFICRYISVISNFHSFLLFPLAIFIETERSFSYNMVLCACSLHVHQQEVSCQFLLYHLHENNHVTED